MPKSSNASDISCIIVGAGGYSGVELISILLDHPRTTIRGLFGSEKRGDGDQPQSISAVFPRLRNRIDLPILPTSPEALFNLKPDVAFLATPHAVSHDLAPALADRDIKVLDLSAAFRLKDLSLYPKHYAFEHASPAWVEKAVYGIPELHRAQLSTASLIAVAGCYPTSAILPLAPLIRAGALDLTRRPIVDSTSGVSGAGRHATLTTSFCEVSLQPYNVFKHRHNPEIDAYAGAPVVFTPHLGAFERGILSTIHAELAPGWNSDRITKLLHETYAAEPFIRLLPSGQWPSLSAVRHTNFCDIAWAVDESHGHLILVSALDNLIKGASGQAVQCMNAAFKFPETMGIPVATSQGISS